MLRALIIGCGNVAGNYDLRGLTREVWSHAKAYQLTPGVELVGVIDSSIQIARRFAEIWKVPFFGTKLIPAVSKLKADLVSICSPTVTQVPLINELCHVGVRGILCEKPLAYDVRQAEKAVLLCEESGILLAVNYQRNWDRQLSKLGCAIRAGELGRVQLIRVLYSKGLLHSGSHFVSLLHAWFGELHVQQVLAVRRRSKEDLYADFSASCSKAPGIVFQNIPEHAYTVQQVECFCTNGRLELNKGGLEIRWTGKEQNPLLPDESRLAGKSEKIPATLSRAMLEVIRNVTSTLRGEEQLKCGPENALQTLRFCERVRSLSRYFKAYE